MKLSIRLTFLFLLLNQCLYAQKGFRIGPSVSYLASKPKVLDTIPSNFNFRFKSGFSGGVMLYYGFSRTVGVSASVLYTSKGYRIFNDSNKNGNILKHNQSLLEIPINLVLKQRLNSVSFVRVNLGFTVCNMISSTSKELTNKNGSFRIMEETKNSFYPMLNIGLEVSHEAKNKNVFVFGAILRQGLSNTTNLGIFNNKTATKAHFNLGYQGSYIGISASYLFNLSNIKKVDELFY